MLLAVIPIRRKLDKLREPRTNEQHSSYACRCSSGKVQSRSSHEGGGCCLALGCSYISCVWHKGANDSRRTAFNASRSVLAERFSFCVVARWRFFAQDITDLPTLPWPAQNVRGWWTKAIFIAKSSTLFLLLKLEAESAMISSNAVGPSMKSRLLVTDGEVRACNRCFHHFVDVTSLDATSGWEIAADGIFWSETPVLLRWERASLPGHRESIVMVAAREMMPLPTFASKSGREENSQRMTSPALNDLAWSPSNCHPRLPYVRTFRSPSRRSSWRQRIWKYSESSEVVHNRLDICHKSRWLVP